MIETMIKELSAKKQGRSIQHIEAQMKQIEVESYPIPSWPKILIPVGAGLLTSGSVILTLQDTRTILSIIAVLVLYGFGCGIIVWAFKKLKNEENQQKEKYDELFLDKISEK